MMSTEAFPNSFSAPYVILFILHTSHSASPAPTGTVNSTLRIQFPHENVNYHAYYSVSYKHKVLGRYVVYGASLNKPISDGIAKTHTACVLCQFNSIAIHKTTIQSLDLCYGTPLHLGVLGIPVLTQDA